jgi:Villin headpiece domain
MSDDEFDDERVVGVSEEPEIGADGFPVGQPMGNRKLESKMNPLQLKMMEEKRRKEEQAKKDAKAASLASRAAAFGGTKTSATPKAEPVQSDKPTPNAIPEVAKARLDSRVTEMMRSGIVVKNKLGAARGRGRGGRAGATRGAGASPAATSEVSEETSSVTGTTPVPDSDSDSSEDDKKIYSNKRSAPTTPVVSAAKTSVVAPKISLAVSHPKKADDTDDDDDPVKPSSVATLHPPIVLPPPQAVPKEVVSKVKTPPATTVSAPVKQPEKVESHVKTAVVSPSTVQSSRDEETWNDEEEEHHQVEAPKVQIDLTRDMPSKEVSVAGDSAAITGIDVPPQSVASTPTPSSFLPPPPAPANTAPPKIYSYSQLRVWVTSKKRSENLDVRVDALEMHLSNDEFCSLFEVKSRNDFTSLPIWKQESMKKKLKLHNKY